MVPVLDAVPVKVVVVVVSWKVVVVLVSVWKSDPAPSPPFIQPPSFHVLLELDVSVHELVLELVLDPVHTVSHEFQTVGANPVCGSTFNVLTASCIVESKLPSTLIIFASNLTVSTQVSDAGVNSRDPCQKLIKKGVTLSFLVAKVCFNHSTSA